MCTNNQDKGSAPIVSNVEIWTTYDRNEDYLLRYGIIKDSDPTKIRFEALDTKIISKDKKMFAEDFEEKDLKEDMEIGDNFDLNTFLYVLFEFKEQELKYEERNKETELKISFKKKGEKEFTKIKNSLKYVKCQDDGFFNENIKKKIRQLKKLLDNKYSEFQKENIRLKNRNKDLAEELEKIKNINKIMKN